MDGQAGRVHSHDFTVGSSDYPVLADERTTTEMEAIGVLGSKVRYVNGFQLPIGIKHTGP